MDSIKAVQIQMLLKGLAAQSPTLHHLLLQGRKTREH